MKINGAERLMNQAVERGYFNHGVLLVAKRDEILLHQAFGRAKRDSLFDLASLTKPLVTTTLTMKLVESGAIRLTDRLGDHVRELSKHRVGRATVKQLLSHSSGLPAWRPYYEQIRLAYTRFGRRSKNMMRRLIANEPLEARSQPLYSDLGFILLDWLLEACTGRSLDVAVKRDVFRPLGLTDLLFNPLQHGATLAARCAPTEKCPWRKKRLRGEVHDDNCYVMNGVSGHAGCFGTASAVYGLCRELLHAHNGDSSFLQRKTVRTFFQPTSLGSSEWALGWEKWLPLKSRSALMRRQAHVVGHKGFTGTSVWMDLDREIVVVLLTNRVYFGREPNPLPKFRVALHTKIMSALNA